jgi:hypothetical protein
MAYDMACQSKKDGGGRLKGACHVEPVVPQGHHTLLACHEELRSFLTPPNHSTNTIIQAKQTTYCTLEHPKPTVQASTVHNCL